MHQEIDLGLLNGAITNGFVISIHFCSYLVFAGLLAVAASPTTMVAMSRTGLWTKPFKWAGSWAGQFLCQMELNPPEI